MTTSTQTPSRTRHKSPESPVHRKVPDGFGGRLRGKGPQQRDLAAQPILLPGELVKHRDGVEFVVDQDPVGALGSDAPHKSLGVAVGPGSSWWDLHDVDALGGEHV